MSKKNKVGEKTAVAIVLLIAFIVYTLLLRVVDVQPIGPLNSSVGFASLNDLVFNALGTSDTWYTITKLIGYAAIALALMMGVWMLEQMIGRRGVFRANYRFYALMGLYVVMGCLYVAFDHVIVINYRPVLEGGALAPSYPSSHTMLTLTITLSAASAIPGITHRRSLKPVCWMAAIAVSAVMAVGRLLSGVHWISDIVGAVLLSCALVAAYDAASHAIGRRMHHRHHHHASRHS